MKKPNKPSPPGHQTKAVLTPCFVSSSPLTRTVLLASCCASASPLMLMRQSETDRRHRAASSEAKIQKLHHLLSPPVYFSGGEFPAYKFRLDRILLLLHHYHHHNRNTTSHQISAGHVLSRLGGTSCKLLGDR